MQKKPYVVLCGTGGGVRAIPPLVWLEMIRKERGSHFMHGVDGVAGASTACIYLSGFNRKSKEDPNEPHWSEEQMVKNYRHASPRIFHHHPLRRHVFGRIADYLPASSVKEDLVRRTRLRIY
jgi:patatin-like phospholipase/acyl hydrolase